MAEAVGKPSALAIGGVACLGLAALSLLLPSGPSYDPYQWLIWGRDLAHLDLVTRVSGTSWKPLPALIDAALSPLGHAQAAGWLVVARAGGLFAAFMTFRLAVRLVDRRWAWPAGTAAAATFVLTQQVVKQTAVGHAEALAAGVVLLAVERHLDGRRGHAFALGVAAALIRPEVWLFLLIYGGWLWRADGRPARWRLALGGALVPLLWFGGDWIGSGRLAAASGEALHPIRGAPNSTPHPARAVLEEAWWMIPAAARVAIGVALAAAIVHWWRMRKAAQSSTDRRVPMLAVAAFAWIAIVAAMAQRGYAGLPRFLFVADGLLAPVAGAGVAVVAELLSAPRPRLMPVGATAALLTFAALVAPSALKLRADAAAVDTVADRDAGLVAAIARAGGAGRVLDCGRPYTGWWGVTALAYDLGVQPNRVHDTPHGRRPVVFVLARGTTGLHSPLPHRDVSVFDTRAGWNVVDRCPELLRSGSRRAHRVSARAGSRSRARRAART